MLSRLNRFHGHGGVRRVYRLGKPARTNLATLHTLRGDKVKRTKVAVVVSRKVDKSAVRRNRIRRRVYEVVRRELPAIKAPTELVFTIYSPELATMPPDNLKKLLDELLDKAKVER
jgi:ribonuclease P protein component